MRALALVNRPKPCSTTRVKKTESCQTNASVVAKIPCHLTEDPSYLAKLTTNDSLSPKNPS